MSEFAQLAIQGELRQFSVQLPAQILSVARSGQNAAGTLPASYLSWCRA